MVYFLATILLLTGTATTEVTVDLLDGTQLFGNLISWQAGKLTLRDGASEHEVTEEQLLGLYCHQQTSDEAPAILVELTDGSTLPATNLFCDGAKFTCTLPEQLGAPVATLNLPKEAVKSVRLQAISPENLAIWNEIRQIEHLADVLVILRKGKSLDHLPGVLGDISGTHVTFNIDGDELPVKRTKVAGLIYYRQPADSTTSQTCRVFAAGQAELQLANVSLQDEVLTGTTTSGIRFALPFTSISRIDFSGGKLVYLSDLKPDHSKWIPYIGLPLSATSVQSFGRPRYDLGFRGQPLSLRMPTREFSSYSQQTKSYSKGIALRSRTELAYRLPDGFTRFAAMAGIDPELSDIGHCQLVVFGDDEILFDGIFTRNDEPVQIDTSINNVQVLKIVVDFGDNQDLGDILHLCDAKLTK